MSTIIRLDDLPLDLLPLLLSFVVKRSDLANCCRVSTEWRAVAEPLLYKSIRCWGRDLAIVPALLDTLANSRRLCALIYRLELRVFPLSLILAERLEMEQRAIQTLKQCINLRELLWTRKGALTDSVFDTVTTHLRGLRHLEINAHTALTPGSWSATHLLNLPPLRSISLILPDRNIAMVLPDFLARQKELSTEDELDLRFITILCRESPVINDLVLKRCIPHLEHTNLESLAIAGASKLTGEPLVALLPKLRRLRHLALEATNVQPHYFRLFAPSLAHLKSLKLTHPGPHAASLSEFFPSLATLLQSTRELESFTLYHSGAASTGSRTWAVVDHSFIDHVVLSVGPRLRKFECSNVLIQLHSAEALIAGMPMLRDLVLHFGHDLNAVTLERIATVVERLDHLRTLHILCQVADVSHDDVLALAERARPSLRQIGFRNRVWHVIRTFNHPEYATDSNSATTVASSGVPDRPKTRTSRRARATAVRFVETAEAFGAFRRTRYGAEEDAEPDVADISEPEDDDDDDD